MRRSLLIGPGSVAVSIALHGLGLAAGEWCLAGSLAGSRDAPAVVSPLSTIDVAFEAGTALRPSGRAGTGSGLPHDPFPSPSAVAAREGGEKTSRPDLASVGRGGTDEASARALNLADKLDGITLNRDPMNRLEGSQVQRVRSDTRRQSRDDRRATPQPMELALLASGPGRLAQRRDPSRFVPARGNRLGAKQAGSRGSVPGGPELVAERVRQSKPAPGSQAPGTRERDRVGMGLVTGAVGASYRRSAAVTYARPQVVKGRAAVPATTRGRPSDTVDSSQAVDTAIASLIHASTAGGTPGHGPGGQRGKGPLGSQGRSGSGSRSGAAGRGLGGDEGADQRYFGYFGRILRKVEPFWRTAFPQWAISEGRGGLATIGMTVHRDGSVTAVHVVRSSGLPQFDRNLVAAVKRASPYGPLPRALASQPLRMNLCFDATNPAVGRAGPGPGYRVR